MRTPSGVTTKAMVHPVIVPREHRHARGLPLGDTLLDVGEALPRSHSDESGSSSQMLCMPDHLHEVEAHDSCALTVVITLLWSPVNFRSG